MARSARDVPRKADQPTSAPLPLVQDDRLIQRLQTADVSTTPIRTLIIVEVGDIPVREMQEAVLNISQIYAKGKHPTYVVPVRNGRMASDVVFERGLLEMITDLCEVKDGQIVMRGGWRDVDLLRVNL